MRRVKVRRVDGHTCSLPLQDDPVVLYVYEGIFVQLRRKLRTYFMINPSFPETRSVFKSTAQIRHEEGHHLRRHYYMIHPFSQGRVTWEIIMIVVYTSLLLFLPLEIIFVDPPQMLLIIIVFFLALCLIDIILFFFTGYYEKKSRKVVMNPRKVCMRYLFTWFIPDAISTFPYNLLIHYSQDWNLYYIQFLFAFKIFRVHTLIEYMKKYCLRLEIWSFKMKSVGVFIYFLVVVWWGTIYLYLVYLTTNDLLSAIVNETRDIFTPLTRSCMHVLRALLLVSAGAIDDESIPVQLFYILLLVGGCVLNLVIIIQIFQLHYRYASMKDKSLSLTQEICEYMNFKELAAPTQKRILRYADFKFRKNIFKDADMLSTMSSILQQDILLHNCRRLVEQVDFFKNLPTPLMASIVRRLKRLIFLGGDNIVQAGVMGNAMFFIFAGTVAVYSAANKEICHLEDGDHFGEISLVINEPRVATVVAVTECEVYRLGRKDFLEVVERYPSVSYRIKKSALARLKNTRRFRKMEEFSDVTTFDEELDRSIANDP